jgi:transaldolase
MNENHLRKVGELGQSIWLDYIRRDLIDSGELKRLIKEDGLRGMTSNTTIFEKAIGQSQLYDADIHNMILSGKVDMEIYGEICGGDVKAAAQVFRPLYNVSDARDGYVSLEVNPYLAHDTQGTIAEARRLWMDLKTPNLLIKIPSTEAGVDAIRQLISEGINVNATLLFSLKRYRQVAEAYMTGLEECLARENPIHNVASVASFFVSRIDVVVDPMLEKIMADGTDVLNLAKQAHGQVAIAYAKSAYHTYKEIFSSERFKKLVDHGAQSQRLLWASMGTKNEAYSDVKYVEALIGKDSVNTISMDTLDAYREHGEPKSRIEVFGSESHQVLQQVHLLGINMDQVTQQLEEEGVEKFMRSFDGIVAVLTKARQVN